MGWRTEHWCEGCETIRAEREMAWTPDGLLYRCAACREIVCIHGKPINNFCRLCREQGVDQVSGLPRHRWFHRSGDTLPPANLSQWPVPCE